MVTSYYDIWYRENVLVCTIIFNFCVLFRENVLAGTKSWPRGKYGDRCAAPEVVSTIYGLDHVNFGQPGGLQKRYLFEYQNIAI